MCGKFTQGVSWRSVNVFSRPLTADDAPGATEFTTPMRDAFVIALDAAGTRVVHDMRWGWPRPGGRDPMHDRPHHMHAKSETIDELPTFAQIFRERRGFMWVQTFNVGEELPNGKVKQWICVHPERTPLALAVIHREFADSNGEVFCAFVMVTAAANPQIATKTDRMPAILDEADIPLWLGETPAHLLEVKAVLKPYAGELLITEQGAAKKAKPPSRTKSDATPGLF